MEMLPDEASKSLAANEAAPLVEPSAAAFCMESVVPLNESGEETVVECDHVMAATGEEAQVVGHRRGRWPCSWPCSWPCL